ncbi:MAG: type II toxin-antitoxin system ParD family antitoxin [Propionibacteriaceae bacterium]|nr:type II toxin-antitoxin system ParD family antitoxin [Propionibacteriaceae bacterium]
MPTMNISLTDDLRTFVDEQVTQGSFQSTSEYVRTVLRREKDIATLRASVLAGATGPWTPMDEAYFTSLRSAIR